MNQSQQMNEALGNQDEVKSDDVQSGTIHLQAIGKVSAIPASQLEVGDITMWNWGSLGRVKSIDKSGKVMIKTVLTFKDKDYPRKFKPNRMVAVPKPQDAFKKAFEKPQAPSAN